MARKLDRLNIQETFKLELVQLEVDYPDQMAEYRVHELQQKLVQFVRHIADEYSDSVEECRVIEFEVAMTLLKSFQSDYGCELLKRRLMSRRAVE